MGLCGRDGVDKGREDHGDGRGRSSTPPEAPLLLTVPEAARLLRLGRNSVYELVACHRLPALRFGRTIRIPRAGLEAWVQRAALEKTDGNTAAWLSVKPPSLYQH